jgi:thiopeptide-type bacteriocin biosynthesis protein
VTSCTEAAGSCCVPKPKDLGWADGRIHEIAIPVRSTRCIAPVRWSDETTDRHHSYLPTLDGRLYLKLHSNHGQQDEIVIRHVPDLQQRLGTQLARCWFIRYDHPNEQLRLRLALESHALVSSIKEVSTWTERLRDEGLVSSVSWETYFPETARFGGSAAIGPAEAFFTADSTATIAQLVASTARHGPDVRALTAASLIDIVVAFIGDEDKAMRWLIGHTVTDAIPPPRLLYKEAVALSTTRDVGADVVAAWDHRRAALTAYRDALHQAGTITPEDLLPDLLHLHHARVNGPDLAAERRCLHLARAAALSRIARTRRMQPA